MLLCLVLAYLRFQPGERLNHSCHQISSVRLTVQKNAHFEELFLNAALGPVSRIFFTSMSDSQSNLSTIQQTFDMKEEIPITEEERDQLYSFLGRWRQRLQTLSWMAFCMTATGEVMRWTQTNEMPPMVSPASIVPQNRQAASPVQSLVPATLPQVASGQIGEQDKQGKQWREDRPGQSSFSEPQKHPQESHPAQENGQDYQEGLREHVSTSQQLKRSGASQAPEEQNVPSTPQKARKDILDKLQASNLRRLLCTTTPIDKSPSSNQQCIYKYYFFVHFGQQFEGSHEELKQNITMDTDFQVWKEEFMKEEDVQRQQVSSELRMEREKRKKAPDVFNSFQKKFADIKLQFDKNNMLDSTHIEELAQIMNRIIIFTIHTSTHHYSFSVGQTIMSTLHLFRRAFNLFSRLVYGKDNGYKWREVPQLSTETAVKELTGFIVEEVCNAERYLQSPQTSQLDTMIHEVVPMMSNQPNKEQKADSNEKKSNSSLAQVVAKSESGSRHSSSS